MLIYKGIGVCGGIAIGKATLTARQDAKVTRAHISDAEAEVKRFFKARDRALDELTELYRIALPEVGEAGAQIFEIHKMMLCDDDYCDSVTGTVERLKVNTEYAVAVSADNFEAMFKATNDSYMMARAADIRDISNRLIDILSGNEKSSSAIRKNQIICADDLAPSETVTLDKNLVSAFVTANGSRNSHTSILARSMNIPTVIGVGDGFLSAIHDDDTLIVNGTTGEVILSPDAATLREAEQRRARDIRSKELLDELRGKENVTLDGRSVNVFANIGSADNIGSVLLCDAGGIGLFRSEFIYLESDTFPTEEEQFNVYRRVLESMAGKKVIIRTLDIGADKQAAYFGLKKEENPALGLRALRICLTMPEVFRTQLRALYRASAYGRLGIMFPMVTSVSEVTEVLEICKSVRSELASEGITAADDIELGIMIETPASAVIADRLAPLVDFFSVGTNDLTQYTLACDRQNPTLEKFCDPHHEAVLRLIEYAAECAHAHGKWIGICGELAADTALTETFLRMGIDELSVSPSYVLKLRKAIRGLDLSKNKP